MPAEPCTCAAPLIGHIQSVHVATAHSHYLRYEATGNRMHLWQSLWQAATHHIGWNEQQCHTDSWKINKRNKLFLWAVCIDGLYCWASTITCSNF